MEEKEQAQYSYRQLFRVVYRFIRPYRGRFWFATVVRVSADMAYLYATYIIAQAFGFFAGYQPGESLERFWHLFVIWAAVYAYFTGARLLAKYYGYQVAERARLDCKMQALEHFTNVDMAWHEKENTGNKMKRIQNGGDSLDRLLRIWIDILINIVVSLIGITVIMAVEDLRIGLLMVLFFITNVLVAWPVSRRVSEAARVVSQEEEEFSGLAFELTNNIRSVKVMGMAKRLLEMLRKQRDYVFDLIVKRIWWFRIRALVENAWSHLFRVISMVIIVYGIMRGQFDISFLLLFNFYSVTLRSVVDEFSNASQDIIVARFRLARVEGMLEVPVQIDNVAGKGPFPKEWQTISFRDVSFAYGDHQVLQGVTFDIRRGERIGIVGLSGAGKSTLFKLLLKEYENFTGEILFDGVSIKDIRKSDYGERVAVVLQETEVFHFSLKENITIGNAALREDAAVFDRAMTIAHVTDFASRLSDGADTLVGEKGVKLSGGEKQRVGIARAIFKQPDILFLDEATSHLDLESEEKIKDSLHHFFQEVTAVVIAHRLTTIQEMDRILVMEHGRILESGNFAALYKQKGRFYDLWEKQRL